MNVNKIVDFIRQISLDNIKLSEEAQKQIKIKEITEQDAKLYFKKITLVKQSEISHLYIGYFDKEKGSLDIGNIRFKIEGEEIIIIRFKKFNPFLL